MYLNARQFKEQIYSWFPKLNGRPHELFKQDNNKKITSLTADTPLKIYELGFSGVILVISTSPFEECDFSSSSRGSNIRNMVLLETTQEEAETKNDENETPRVSYHNVLPFPSSSLRSELNVTVANSHQIQHQLPPSTTCQSTIYPLSIISIRRRSKFSSMDTAQQILICRDHILEDAVGFYNTDEIILNKLYVRFAGGQGEDLEGVSRDFFCTFWKRFSELYATGDREKYFRIGIKSTVESDLFAAGGRIVIHGFILLGYIPPYLNKAVIFMLLSVKMLSNAFITDSYLECISENSENKIKNALDDFDSVSKVELAEAFVNFNLESPRLLFGNFKLFIERISKLKVILELYFLLSSCLVHRHFIKELEEVEISKFIDDCQPTGVDLVKLLAPQYTEETVNRGLEERVVSIVEMYIANLKFEKLQLFLCFTTGADILPASLRLTFNGNTNEEMMVPIGHTCTEEFEVSRFITSLEQFSTIMDNILLNSENAWKTVPFFVSDSS